MRRTCAWQTHHFDRYGLHGSSSKFILEAEAFPSLELVGGEVNFLRTDERGKISPVEFAVTASGIETTPQIVDISCGNSDISLIRLSSETSTQGELTVLKSSYRASISGASGRGSGNATIRLACETDGQTLERSFPIKWFVNSSYVVSPSSLFVQTHHDAIPIRKSFMIGRRDGKKIRIQSDAVDVPGISVEVVDDDHVTAIITPPKLLREISVGHITIQMHDETEQCRLSAVVRNTHHISQ